MKKATVASTAGTGQAGSRTAEPRIEAWASEPGGELDPGLEIAVLIPCLNEEATIGKVVRDFRAALPTARVYVYDNNSSDRTVAEAAAAGAICKREMYPGKGNVVRRMFADELDMINGARVTAIQAAYRPGHRFGNKLLTSMVAIIFGNRFDDMLSGYRVFSNRFVKSFPALSTGFEIETELTVHALELRMPTAEIRTPYCDRPQGSTSKLKTVRDGIRILKTIGLLIKEERPFELFSAFFGLFSLISIYLAWPIVVEFMQTGLVPRFPTAILSTGLMLLAFLSLACGLVLDTVPLGRREAKRRWYLNTPQYQADAPVTKEVRKLG